MTAELYGLTPIQRVTNSIEEFLLDGYEPDTKPLWTPNPPIGGQPNPQQLAVESEADELFYGGAAGGGKTDLMLGLAFTQHKRSIIFRRVYPNLKAIIDRSYNIAGEHGTFNLQHKRWTLPDKLVDFGAMQYEKDKKSYQGQPYDFYGFDEVPEFTRTQFQFVIAWNRSTDPQQRCRVVVAGNPPIDDAGSWVIEEFAPWLDDTFGDPAEPGELRWYYRDADKLVWLRSGKPVKVGHETIYPRSRTFIPARLSDNPHLSTDSAYTAVLQALPEPLRSQLLYGDFGASSEQDPWQVIPTEWVQMAQKRWAESSRPQVRLSGVGVDCARGGGDKTVIAKRYDDWIEYRAYRGVDTPDGPSVAAKVTENVSHDAMPPFIVIDVIGIGSSVYDTLEDIYAKSPNIRVVPLNVSERSEFLDISGALKMRNKRAEMYWRMREALDPAHGSLICLPPDKEVIADLCAAKYKYTPSGVLIESKDEIKARIGRSPDVGEAIMMTMMGPVREYGGVSVDVPMSAYKTKRRSIWD